MIIRGILKTSLIDFPEHISAVVFTGGCNLRCSYCYNRDLVQDESGEAPYTEDEVLSFLEKRKTLLDGVTVSGGEPCMQKDIVEFTGRLRATGLRIKIDTNGFFPSEINEIVRMKNADYIAVDIKTSPSKYKELTNTRCDMSKLGETLDILKKSGIEYELRTTAVPGFISDKDFREIGDFTGKVSNYYIQQFVNENTLDPEFEKIYSHPENILKGFSETVSGFAENVRIRGL